MFFDTIFPVLFSLVCVGGARARPQSTIVLPFTPDAGTHAVSASIIGTGASGETTYLLTYGNGDLSGTNTATLVEDASAATAVQVFTGLHSAIETESIACQFQNGIADCTDAIFGVDTQSQTTSSFRTIAGTAGTLTLAVATSSVTPSETASGSVQSSGAGRNTGSGILLSGVLSLGLGARLLD